MDMYVAKSKFHDFAAFWRGLDSKVNFYVSGALELRFARDMRQSAWFLTKSISGDRLDFESEESLVQFATEVILGLSPTGKQNSIEQIKKSRFASGQKNRRVWRGVAKRGGDFCIPFPQIEYNDYKVKLRAVRNASELFDEFSDCFRYLEPNTDNYKAYSNRMRELLILACTEIEANFSGVLEVNGIRPARSYYNTGDFAKLIRVLHLKEWGASLNHRVGCGNIYPFRDWNVNKGTQTLEWYHAYNKVKHDAFESLSLANFFNVYSAMSALYILLISQWGVSVFQDARLHVPFGCVCMPIYEIDDIPVAVDLEVEPEYAPLII
ncbi:hypothetical protein LOY46_17115 [Pseudomonas sichuanensis]|uniref:hypothetical protein n=1 Tax=Pseudomonas sichuanensis TaxID=2213015 RepID=UPI00215E3EE8|nr:hypothetical protein [Pseudomonas sichuanensis]UVK81288.1 hypothetical protein LOY46_17115 [Pseudomonas sichuanensis]